MKLIIIISAILLAFSTCVEVESKLAGPVYEEVPMIVKSNSPLDLNINRRIDMINLDGKTKRAMSDARDRKTSLRSELARGFNLKALNEWLDHLGSQNLDLMHKTEFMDDLLNLKGFAKILQSHVTSKANSIMNNLTLMDLKLKEKKLIEQEIQQVIAHPGNINSNQGDNSAWKERLDEIVSNAASVHSEFNTSIYGVCEVIKRINYFIKKMENNCNGSKKVIRLALPNNLNSTSTNKIAPKSKARRLLIKDIKKSILPEIKKMINAEVKKALRSKSKSKPMSVLKNIIKEESDIKKVPSAASEVKYVIKRTVRKYALQIASRTATTIVNLSSVKKAKKALAKSGNKVTRRVKKFIRQAKRETKTELKILKRRLVKKMRKHSRKQIQKRPSGKASVKPLVEKSAAKALMKINPNKISKKINKKIKLPTSKKGRKAKKQRRSRTRKNRRLKKKKNLNKRKRNVLGNVTSKIEKERKQTVKVGQIVHLADKSMMKISKGGNSKSLRRVGKNRSKSKKLAKKKRSKRRNGKKKSKSKKLAKKKRSNKRNGNKKSKSKSKKLSKKKRSNRRNGSKKSKSKKLSKKKRSNRRNGSKKSKSKKLAKKKRSNRRNGNKKSKSKSKKLSKRKKSNKRNGKKKSKSKKLAKRKKSNKRNSKKKSKKLAKKLNSNSPKKTANKKKNGKKLAKRKTNKRKGNKKNSKGKKKTNKRKSKGKKKTNKRKSKGKKKSNKKISKPNKIAKVENANTQNSSIEINKQLDKQNAPQPKPKSNKKQKKKAKKNKKAKKAQKAKKNTDQMEEKTDSKDTNLLQASNEVDDEPQSQEVIRPAIQKKEQSKTLRKMTHRPSI